MGIKQKNILHCDPRYLYIFTTDHYMFTTDHYIVTTNRYIFTTDHYIFTTDHYLLIPGECARKTPATATTTRDGRDECSLSL